MYIVPESLIAGLVFPQDAFSAMEACFAAMARGEARNFPVVREALGGGRQYGFKSGLVAAGGQLGLKGGYLPGNAARGITNHQPAACLFDPETGVPLAMAGGNLPTALRRAAVSIDRLARPDARVLGLMGAGHRAQFHLRAAARVRALGRVIARNRAPDRLERLRAVACAMIFCFVLDLPPVPEGGTRAAALPGTPAQARQAKGPGCSRFWLAGRHNRPGIGPAPSADRCAMRALRCGSGGQPCAGRHAGAGHFGDADPQAGARHSRHRQACTRPAAGITLFQRRRRQGPASGKGRQKSRAERASGE
ncbi:MAG: hypothetical protein IOC80_01675 [Rhodobacter sp.]|nr:hypothetical protein [Rhodobacter sp.]MCA3512937.1 hypothetical protein [Rhodobacter sp.]MCA3520916.1 hypothetical protein [Rhodobacter sp.]MCA3522441.1 hypothetical protein [Rhodobacter sp.]MCA3525948.1 hypothetical protein [Rhodobacter sp.]